MNPITVPSKAMPAQKAAAAPKHRALAANPDAAPPRPAVIIDIRSRSRSPIRNAPLSEGPISNRTTPSYHGTRLVFWHPPYQWWSVPMVRAYLGPEPPFHGVHVLTSRFFECDCYNAQQRCQGCHQRMCDGCRFWRRHRISPWCRGSCFQLLHNLCIQSEHALEVETSPIFQPMVLWSTSATILR